MHTNYTNKKARGFTLLGLLIVIGIIGILASVALVSFPSATKKAKLGNALRFSDNVRGSLQPDMVAWWKFDETTGTIAKDTWWNQLHGTVYGATWVPGIKNNALSFNGSTDYVRVINNPLLYSTDEMTISAWVKTSSATAQSIMQKGDNCNINPDKWFYYSGSTLVLRSMVSNPDYYIASANNHPARWKLA